jgi:hypothetical protein
MALAIDWGKFVTEPHDKQKEFITSCLDPSKQYVAAFCGLQSGKTLSMCDAASALIYGDGAGFKPVMLPEGMRGKTPMEVWLVSKSYALAEVLLETFRWRTNPEIWATDRDLRGWGLQKGDRFTYWLRPRPGLVEDPAPIKLRLRTASDPEAMRATPTLTLALCDELAYWKDRSWNNLQARALVARTKFIITTTPRGKNFVYRQIAMPGGYGGATVTDQKIAVHTWTSRDNPHADKDHIKRMERIFGREYAKQELQALFTDQVGYVYGEFDRTIHMVPAPSDKPDDYEVIVGGIDPGMRDPYACSVWGKYQGKWFQLWEYYQTGKTDVQVAPALLMAQDRWEVKRWYCDKRRPSDIQNLRDLGVKVVPNIDIHWENDSRTIAPMVAFCKELLRTGKLFIGVDHDATAEEFEKYAYPDEVDEREKNTNDTPKDWMNHLCDAMRYCLCSEEEASIQAPRYRQGANRTPQPVDTVSRGDRAIASMQEYLKAQDDRMDREDEVRMGSRRRAFTHPLRNGWLRGRGVN